MAWLISLFVLVALAIGTPWVLRALIRKRLKGYRIRFNEVRDNRPLRIETSKRVAILGGGLAGVSAAATLGERGFDVTVFESNGYLGGKLGSWEIELGNGERAWVSHGFHAFFRHYYNLNTFLDRLGLRATFRDIGDYVILGQDGSTISFRNLSTTPIFNLLSMARNGTYRLRDIVFGPARDLMGIFLEYDPRTTFALYDHVSLADFDRLAKLPPRLKLAFTTFSRAFFSNERDLSLAELVKCFHFYYLGHDRGLIYDFPVRDYEPALWVPIRAHLQTHGVTLRLNTPVTSLRRQDGRYTVNDEHFDAIVLATDVIGARAIMTQAPGLDELRDRFEGLRPGRGYAVLRLWLDRDVREGLPVFVITDKVRVLDSVTVYHRFEAESAAWVDRNGGAVLELHCYAVPEELMGATQIRDGFIEELVQFFPELKGFAIRHETMQFKRDFTAFHTGMHDARPETDSGLPGLYFAGDWVKLPFPAMLLEGAFASGLLAANRILAAEGLREEPVDSVPLEGVMAGMPQPPARKALHRR